MQKELREFLTIFIHNYQKNYLAKCFERIFSQNSITDFEVVFSDDATRDGSWEIAIQYAEKFPGRIALNRNRISIGPRNDLHLCKHMFKGRYFVELCQDSIFSPDYILNAIATMEADPYAKFEYVHRTYQKKKDAQSIFTSPLVSVLIYNYNYGRYLRQCLDSVLAQTYQNYEICFSDNASTDSSWEIALEYARKYPEKFKLARNKKNEGAYANWMNCSMAARGKYIIDLCSDDAFMPDHLSQCVNALEQNPRAKFAIVHRKIMNADGVITDEPPFYNRSCIVPGEEQAAVYMMAAVNPSISQVMYNKDAFDFIKTKCNSTSARWFGKRELDFKLCSLGDMVYIKDPLVLHREHSQSDSSSTIKSYVQILAVYILLNELLEFARENNFQKAIDRYPHAVSKQGDLCLRYCSRLLSQNEEEVSKQYFNLAHVFKPDIHQDINYALIADYWNKDVADKEIAIDSFIQSDNLLTRTCSYDPPEGSVPI